MNKPKQAKQESIVSEELLAIEAIENLEIQISYQNYDDCDYL